MNEHREECECFFCRHPEIQDYVTDMVKSINKEKMTKRIIIVKNIIKALMLMTKLNLVSREGILNVIGFELIGECQAKQFIESLEEMVGEEGEIKYIA